MGLLATGVAATLWLSTQAIADSYRLEEINQQNALLAERAEQLQRYVTDKESASSLAQAAAELGMVPGGDPARIVVGADGSIKVVGEPKKATAPAPPPAREEAQPDTAQGERSATGQPDTENGRPSDGQSPDDTEAGDRAGDQAGDQQEAEDDPAQLAAGDREAEQRTVPAAGGR
jgi:hypothetical protein